MSHPRPRRGARRAPARRALAVWAGEPAGSETKPAPWPLRSGGVSPILLHPGPKGLLRARHPHAPACPRSRAAPRSCRGDAVDVSCKIPSTLMCPLLLTSRALRWKEAAFLCEQPLGSSSNILPKTREVCDAGNRGPAAWRWVHFLPAKQLPGRFPRTRACTGTCHSHAARARESGQGCLTKQCLHNFKTPRGPGL